MKEPSIKYSILELASIPEGRSVSQVYGHITALAEYAESLGFERIWLGEHHNYPGLACSATLVLIGYMAEATSHIRIGASGVVLPKYAPISVAETFATLESLYPGRIDLGLVRSPWANEETAMAIRSDHHQKRKDFDQEVEVLLSFFEESNRDAAIRVPFAEGLKVPAYILGGSLGSAELAARLGLPYAFACHFGAPDMEAILTHYRTLYQPSALHPAPYVIASINVIAADTDQEAGWLSTSFFKTLTEGKLTGKVNPLQPPTALTNELRAALMHPAAQPILDYTFIGGPDTIAEKVTALTSSGLVDELMAVSNIHDFHARTRSFTIFAEAMKAMNRKKLMVSSDMGHYS